MFGKREPEKCGGTNRSYDENAPKIIKSDNMTFFKIASALSPVSPEGYNNKKEQIWYVSAFAAAAGKGTFILLETRNMPDPRVKGRAEWAYIKDNIFPSLSELVRELDLAAENGKRSFTNGLPRNFGGSVDIRYAEGEKIYFSSNQHPVLKYSAAERIVEFFKSAFQLEKLEMLYAADAKIIKFDECSNGRDSFSHYIFTKHPGEESVISRSCRYSGSEVYESEQKVSTELFDRLCMIADGCGMTVWNMLPENEYKCRFDSVRELTFVYSDEIAVRVPYSADVPDQFGDKFFEIQHSITSAK